MATLYFNKISLLSKMNFLFVHRYMCLILHPKYLFSSYDYSCSVLSCVKKCVSSGGKVLKYLATELNPIIYLCMKQPVSILERTHG